ncbi:MAG: flavodoxin family protein [Methanocorpusculum sp.]|nr:flavodoxin family protein [Methanocorpusculum sp.]
MKLCAIHASPRKGNTDLTIETVLTRMQTRGEIEIDHIYLPKDLPCFCKGCFSCLRRGTKAGEICPDKAYTHPILEKLLAADGIIIGCPSYALAETAQIKTLLDHLACTYINHRPNPEMFDKTALIISTAAGAGTHRVISTIKRNLLFWGVKRILSCRMHLWAGNWSEMPEDTQKKFTRMLQKKADTFYRLTENRTKIHPCIQHLFLRFLFKRLIRRYADTEPDKIYWKARGWL